MLLQPVHQVVAVSDAARIRDDDRRSVVRFGLLEGLDDVGVVAAQRHLRHVHRSVTDGFHGQVLAAVRLAAGSKLRHRAARRGLGGLAAGVRVDAGVENQHVHVFARTEHVIETAESDVVGPSVTAQDPHALAHKGVGNGQQILGIRRPVPGKFFA